MRLPHMYKHMKKKKKQETPSAAYIIHFSFIPFAGFVLVARTII